MNNLSRRHFDSANGRQKNWNTLFELSEVLVSLNTTLLFMGKRMCLVQKGNLIQKIMDDGS